MNNDNPNAPTQKKTILEHLHRFGSIEPLTALREYGVYRLSAIIYELRKDGYNIKTDDMEGRSRITGKPVHYALYTLSVA